MRLLLKALAGVILSALALYAAAVGYLYLNQDAYVYHPSGTLTLPEAKGLSGVQVVTLQAADGVTLTGWYAPAQPGKPTLLYFHGNAENMSDRAPRFAEVLGSGFGLLAMSYRGFPGSGGTPSQQGLFADALAEFDWLAAKSPDIVVYGESLGTGVATYVASQRRGRALVLEAPFTATVDIAAATYPWVPVGILMRDQFRSRDYIKAVDEPLLILHGTEDAIVPVEYGRRLFALAHEPKELSIIEGGHHSDLWKHGSWATVLDFLKRHGVDA